MESTKEPIDLLAGQAANGDPAACEELAKTIEGSVLNVVVMDVATKLRRDPARIRRDPDVEWISNRAVSEICASVHSFDPRRPFWPWARAIVRRWVGKSIPDVIQPETQLEHERLIPEQRVERRPNIAALRAVYRAVRELDARARLHVAVWFLAGSFRRAARILRTADSSVRSSWKQYRRALERSLTGFDEDSIDPSWLSRVLFRHVFGGFDDVIER